MTRAEFLRSLGLSSASLMAVYCMGGLTACSSEDPKPDANTNTGGGGTNGGGQTGKVDVTLNLNEIKYSSLQQNGQATILSNEGIIVARTNKGDFVALSKSCTHQGIQVAFQAGSDRFNCPEHGSNFSTTGSVINGPATRALKQYKTTFDSNANTLRVYEE